MLLVEVLRNPSTETQRLHRPHYISPSRSQTVYQDSRAQIKRLRHEDFRCEDSSVTLVKRYQIDEIILYKYKNRLS